MSAKRGQGKRPEKETDMEQSNTPVKNTEKHWETPTLRVIPVSFEATSYAFAVDDDPQIG
jgi:hypothetical protein